MTSELAVAEERPSLIPDSAAGTYALAILSDDDFTERLMVLKRGRDRIAQIQRELMEENVDYGLIPGTPKPTLFKPGAEKLALIYRLAARIETTFINGDGQLTPPLRYTAECFLHLGSFDGPIVAVGHGTANAWEKRYRREGKKVCPKCGAEAIIKSKAEYGGGWYCFPKAGGCASKFREDDEALANQSSSATGDAVGSWDLDVTLLKMAEKRAHVDAVLRATASSGLFTQDVAEEPVDSSYDEPVKNEPAKKPPATKRTPSGVPVTEDGEVSGMFDDLPPMEPETRDSAIPGVGRGGQTSTVNSVQIAQIKAYSKSLKLGPHGLANICLEMFGDDDLLTLPKDPAEASAQLMVYLTALTSADVGDLLRRLREEDEDDGIPMLPEEEHPGGR